MGRGRRFRLDVGELQLARKLQLARPPWLLWRCRPPRLHSAGVCCSPHLQRGQLTARQRAVSIAVVCILFLLFYFPEIPFVVRSGPLFILVQFPSSVACSVDQQLPHLPTCPLLHGSSGCAPPSEPCFRATSSGVIPSVLLPHLPLPFHQAGQRFPRSCGIRRVPGHL
ncbi:hypothetical protein ACQJBY_006433 [Aegilops geniculata]